MKKFLQLVVLIMLAMYNAVQHVTGGTTLKKLMPTGVIEQGILGGFSGKVGPVVGGSWKGINYMRGYVVPANPNTTGQQAQRTKFGLMVRYAQQILSSVIHTYWNPFAVQMSGYNHFIQENINLLDVNNLMDETAKMTIGTLEGSPGLVTGVLNLGDVDVSWDNTLIGNALATDFVLITHYDTSENVLSVPTVSETRTDGSLTYSPVQNAVEGDILFLTFYRGTGEGFVVSDSQSAIITS